MLFQCEISLLNCIAKIPQDVLDPAYVHCMSSKLYIQF